jgi:predicted transcriptional regulator
MPSLKHDIRILKALAHLHRFAIIDILFECDCLYLSFLKTKLKERKISTSNTLLSHNLKVLIQNNLIIRKRTGREMMYVLNPKYCGNGTINLLTLKLIKKNI